jgi:hypothetical protein
MSDLTPDMPEKMPLCVPLSGFPFIKLLCQAFSERLPVPLGYAVHPIVEGYIVLHNP